MTRSSIVHASSARNLSKGKSLKWIILNVLRKAPINVRPILVGRDVSKVEAKVMQDSLAYGRTVLSANTVLPTTELRSKAPCFPPGRSELNRPPVAATESP